MLTGNLYLDLLLIYLPRGDGRVSVRELLLRFRRGER
jgi:hypothetical protein